MDQSAEFDLGNVSGALTDAQREEFIKRALAAKGMAGNPGLVQLMQDKLDRLVGKSSGYLESLPKKVKNRVNNLKKLQEEHDELEEQYLKEKAELEAKYNAKYAPLYEKRAAIVGGEFEPEELPPKEGEEAKAGEAEKPEATSSENKEEEDVKGIPNFWLTALRNNLTIEETITEKDEGALEYLRDIKWHPLESQKGFTLEFYFAPNPYFTNTVLTKSYYMVEDEEPILERAEGTPIEWLPGKNLTQKTLRKKPKKGAKNAKPVTKTEQVPSFFNFFSPPTIPDGDDDMDEQEAEELQDQMEADYDVGSALKEKIIPHAVEWFTGEAQEIEDDYDDEEEGLEDVDEEDEDEDDDDEDDDDEDDAPPPRARKGAGGLPARQNGAAPASGKPGEQPPECKQQ